MDLIPPTVTVGLIVLALCGALIQQPAARIACCILAVPSLGFACFALRQGGIAEPFSGRQMLGFCTIGFMPAVGCAAGQVRTIMRRKSQNNTSKPSSGGRSDTAPRERSR